MIGLVIVLCLFVLIIVGWIQIITKAGYSPWWILVPLSLPVLWVITISILFSGFSGAGTYGFFDVQGVADGASIMGKVTLVDLIANYAFFLIFAFSDWPVMQAARSRHTPRTGGGDPQPRRVPGPGSGPGQASGAGAGATSPTPSPATESGPGAQAPGWYQSGALGAGEQSYWDGSAWTARRRWSRGAWMDLPMVPVGDGSEPPV
jgi:hypothetical protein